MAEREPIATLFVPRLGRDWITANKRQHWTKTAALVSEWRGMTLLCAHEQRFPRRLPFCEIQPVFYFDTNRRRDPGNFVLTTKVIVDALCTGPKPPHGWGSWVDDDPRYLREFMPRLTVSKDHIEGVYLLCYESTPEVM